MADDVQLPAAAPCGQPVVIGLDLSSSEDLCFEVAIAHGIVVGFRDKKAAVTNWTLPNRHHEAQI